VVSLVPRVVLTELERRGIPAERLLARHGLTRASLEDPEAWVSQRAHAKFFRDAVEASGDPAFAWAVGSHTPVEATRMVGQGAMLSATVRQALQTWSRYYELFLDGAQIGTRSTSQHDAVLWTRLPSFPPLHDNCLSFAAVLLRVIERISGPVRPLELQVTGAAPSRDAAAVVEKAVGAPVRWGAAHFEVRLPPGTFDRPTFTSDPAFRGRMIELAERDLAMRSGASIVARVRAAILREGLDRSSDIVRVANLLGTTPRTLQRWLTEEGRSFTEVRDVVLAQAARRMLAEEGAPIAVAASRLGFSSRTAFQRSVKRWTGKTPGELARKSPAGDPRKSQNRDAGDAP